MNSPTSDNSNNWHGRFIGDNQRYRIDKPLAPGGMGEVLLATDTRLGQQVVLKLLKDTLVASQEMRQRFEREVTVCAALQSNHIVKIIDCGVTPEGYPFYVMEYLIGETLRQLLRREKRLSVERTVRIISQVCQGLQLAHQGISLKDGSNENIQVIHRDLKPDNIFLLPADFGEWVKILDFGIAKIRKDSSECNNLSFKTKTNTFLGTFRYASPEQIEHKGDLDARADIYSLGIILYEMLSAADPFGFSMKGNNISEISWAMAHTYELPRPLREQPGCKHLSAEIEAIVLKCLQKNPNNRFASVAELNQALQGTIKSAHNTVTQNQQTLAHPEPNFGQDTISKPLQPSPTVDSEEETIMRIQPVQPSPTVDSEEETIMWVQPVQTSPTVDSEEETIMRVQPLENHSNNETVSRPLQQTSEQTSTSNTSNFQHRPSPYRSTISPSEPPSHLQETEQKNPQPANRPQPQQSDGTIFQQPNRPQPQQPDGTIFQQPNRPQPQQPDGTIFQQPNRPQPQQPDGTIFQQPNRPQPQQPDGKTSDQPVKSHNTQNTQNLGKDQWMKLGIALVCLLGIGIGGVFIFSLLSNQDSQDLPTPSSSGIENSQ
jgi:serine/threonine-protein kinase